MSQQSELWIGLVEFKPLNRNDYGAAGAFTNIITWAGDALVFRKKAEIIAATMNLYVTGTEWAEPLRERRTRFTLSDEIEDMVRRAEFNPNAIVYGTFYRYPFDEA